MALGFERVLYEESTYPSMNEEGFVETEVEVCSGGTWWWWWS